MANEPQAKQYTIREAARELGMSEQYIRHAVREGKLPTVKEPINDGQQFRHLISEADLAAWRSRTGSRSSRSDGRNKFVCYLTPTEEKQARAALKKADLGDAEKLLVRANPPKSK